MIQTPRLVLRPWRASDLDPFAAQSADPEVMRYYPACLTRAECEAYVARLEQHLAVHGFCKWAVDVPGVADFIGAVGLTRISFAAGFTPAVEVAWRLSRPYWGHGYATEAARAAIQDGFDRVGLTEVVAITSLPNTPSARVMLKLGMTQDGEFDHPASPPGHPLQRHALYRLRRGPV